MNIKKYQHRYQIISFLDNGFYTASKAENELGISIRQIKNFLVRFGQSKKKFLAIMPKSRLLAWNGLTEEIIEEIIHLKKSESLESIYN